jgi:hypothetical protein
MATRRARQGPAEVFSICPDDEAQQTESSTLPDTGGQTDEELIHSARRTLMKAVPASAEALAKGVGSGSVPHIKLLLQLVGLDEGGLCPEIVRPREKTLEEIVMEQWRKEP